MLKCMLLAAGMGERLRPLTDHRPKPLIKIAGKPLIEHHLEKLKLAGYSEVVINLSYLGNMIREFIDDGRRFGLDIQFSDEGEEPLETAGGIIQALPLLGDKPFLVINSDIWCDHSLSFPELSKDNLAHLILVNNPPHNPDGDFVYEFGNVYNDGSNFLTYSGIGIYDPKLFQEYTASKLPLAPILRSAVDKGVVSAEYYTGAWFDIGTPARLEETENYIYKTS